MLRTSIKLVLTAFVILSVAIAALAAFLPLYFTGLELVESAVDTIREGIIQRSQGEVATLFRRGSDTTLAVSRATYYGKMDLDEDLRTKPYMDSANFLHSTIAGGNGTFTSAFIRSTSFMSVDVDARGTQGENTSVVVYQSNATFVSIETHNEMNDTHLELAYIRGQVNYPFVRSATRGYDQFLNGTGWISPFFSYDDVKLYVVSPYYNPNGEVAGLFGLGILPRDLNRFLANMGLRESGRACVIEAAGNGTLLANSWGQHNAVTTGSSPFGALLGYLIPLWNVSDTLMQRVVDEYGAHGLIHGAVPFAATMGDTESDRTYVDVIEVTDDYGLAVRVIAAMPLADYLGDFYTSRTMVIIILVVAVIVLVFAAVAFSVLLTRPLKRLGTQMSQTASLIDAGQDDAPSSLSEVADMQAAYRQMKAELLRMKSFLPQSLLQHNDEELDTATESHAGSKSEYPFNNPLDNTAHTKHAGAFGVSVTGADTDISFARLGVDASRLRTENNVFASVDCAIALVSVAYHAPPGTAAYTASVEELLAAVVTMAGRHRGVVEQMRPQQVLVTFGGRRRIANPALCALKFALALHKLVASPEIEAATLLDRGTYFLGPCGSADLRHEAIFSPDLDTLLSVAPLVHSSHRVAVAATGRIAPSLTERCVVLPFDTLQFAERLPVQLFAVIGVAKGTVEASDKRIVSQIKRGFGMMCAGNHKAAVLELKQGEQLLGIDHGQDTSSTTSQLMNTSISAELELFYASIAHVIATMISTASALGDSSQAYARRYLGWPTLDGSAPISPVFNSERAAGTREFTNLTQQLSTLSRLKETRTPKFAKRASEGGAKASGLFEMAFALDLEESDSTVERVSVGGESSSAPSAVTTFTDVPAEQRGGGMAPVAQHYLRHWRRSERVLGRGAFGSVYRALHDNGSIAAMKILPLAASTTDLDELRKELVVTAGQRHENLVQFVDAEVSSEELVVITELLPGGSLEMLTTDFGQLPLRVVRRFVVDILRGLSHLHRAGIVHCDVKPANVLVGVDGVAKVADFGSALHPGFEANFGSDAGGDLKIPGTPAYMAPEVARGNAPTPASDIWSFGVMVHELLSGGSRPFNVKQLSQMEGGAFKCISAVGRIQEGGTELREPAKVRLPTTTEDYEAIEAFLSACLQVDAAKRPTCERLLTMEYLL